MQKGEAYKMLICIDVETTGLEERDKICSIGLVVLDNGEVSFKYELINEGKKIPPKASSIHHITNEMLQGKPELLESETYRFLELQNNPQTTLIGHNIHFDLAKLSVSGFKNRCSIIDTLRVSKHLIREVDSYALQYLRYELKLYRQEEGEVIAHNALGDAKVVKLLYEYLIEMATQQKMEELTFEKVLLEKLPFGKYEGRYIEEICMMDRGYLEWMFSQIVDLDDDLRYSICYYLDYNC